MHDPSIHLRIHHTAAMFNVVSAAKEHLAATAGPSAASGSKVNRVRGLSFALARVAELRSHLSFPWRIIPHYSLLTPCQGED